MKILLAAMRILAGLLFLYAGITKLLDDQFLYGGLLDRLESFGQPYPFYQKLLLRYVEFRQTTVAYIVGGGEIAVGFCLLTGFFTSLASLGGVFLLANFALATCANSPGMLGAHIAGVLLLLALGRCCAGLTWGVDGWLIERLQDWVVLFPLRLKAPAHATAYPARQTSSGARTPSRGPRRSALL